MRGARSKWLVLAAAVLDVLCTRWLRLLVCVWEEIGSHDDGGRGNIAFYVFASPEDAPLILRHASTGQSSHSLLDAQSLANHHGQYPSF